MMKCLCVLLCVALSAVSLAATSAIPKRLSLRFTIGSKQAKVRLNLKELHDLAAWGGEYEQQAQLALENIELLPRVDNPLLMINLLKSISRAEAEKDFPPKWQVSHDGAESPSYKEQMVVWKSGAYSEDYIREEINTVYAHVSYSMEHGSGKLLKLLSPLKRGDYLNQIDKQKIVMQEISNSRTKFKRLLARYEIEAGEQLQDRKVRQNLVDKIVAEITARDAARAEKIRQQVAAFASSVDMRDSLDMRDNAYYRAMLAEMLHDSGVEEQEQEAKFQLLINDFWAAHYYLRQNF